MSAQKRVWGIWRDGRRLIMYHGSLLPTQCIRCGELSKSSPIRLRLTWSRLSVHGLFEFFLIGLSLMHESYIRVHLCPAHRRNRSIATVSLWVLLAAGVVLLWLAMIKRSTILL